LTAGIITEDLKQHLVDLSAEGSNAVIMRFHQTLRDKANLLEVWSQRTTIFGYAVPNESGPEHAVRNLLLE
jgi:hypothetical protein